MVTSKQRMIKKFNRWSVANGSRGLYLVPPSCASKDVSSKLYPISQVKRLVVEPIQLCIQAPACIYVSQM